MLHVPLSFFPTSIFAPPPFPAPCSLLSLSFGSRKIQTLVWTFAFAAFACPSVRSFDQLGYTHSFYPAFFPPPSDDFSFSKEAKWAWIYSTAVFFFVGSREPFSGIEGAYTRRSFAGLFSFFFVIHFFHLFIWVDDVTYLSIYYLNLKTKRIVGLSDRPSIVAS